MALCIAVIHPDTLEVVTVFGKDQDKDVYLAHISDQDKSKCLFFDVPGEIPPWAVMGVRGADGQVGIEMDPSKDRFFRVQLLRTKRNQLLAESDWTQFPTAPFSDEKRAAWNAYRQALRDFTTDVADPANPVWPTPPS